MLDAAYWEAFGGGYDEAIFDSSRQDRGGVIRARIDALSDSSAAACDFGCGVGHYLPLLASRFRHVYGVDFAESLLEQARARTRKLPNLTLLRANLASSRTRLAIPKPRVALCANVLISDDPKLRRGILRSLARHLARGARALVVVPSLESALYANQRLVEWNRRLGYSDDEALGSGIPATRAGARSMLRGLVRLEGVATKHYLREEAVTWLCDEGLRVTDVEKVEYDWSTEFERPPRWMKPPGPWDWLLVARRS